MNNKTGVSLVVLAITIIVMIILASTIIYVSSDTTNNAKKAAFASDLETIEDLVKEYSLNNSGSSEYIESILPLGYTQLEYIESTGEQYIDTEIVPDMNTQVDYKVRFRQDALAPAPLIGARVGSANNNRFFPLAYSNPNTTFRTTFGYTNQHVGNINFDIDYEGSFQPQNEVSIINGTSYSLAGHSFTKSADYNLYLFATSGYSENLYQSKGVIYYVKIYQNGVLVRNFIPCKNTSNVVGMYDLANDRLYTNQGTGAFVSGPKVAGLVLPVDTQSATYRYNKGALTALISEGKAELSAEISQNGDDDAIFFTIDLNKIPITSVKNGKKENGDNDIYVVSSKTLNVYYVKGNKIGNDYYFSLSKKLTGKSKVNSSNTVDSSSIDIVNKTNGIKLAKSTADWTNALSITADTELKSGETLSYKIADETIGTTTGTIDVASILSSNAIVRNKFYLNDANKKVTFQKLDSSSTVIAEASINVAKLDVLSGDISLATITNTKYDDFILASVSGYNDLGGSGVKEIRVLYTKNTEDEAYYSNLPATVTAEYINNYGKSSAATMIKLPSDVSEYKIIFIDNAGNLSAVRTVEISD